MKNSLMATRTHASDLLDGTVDQFLGYLIGWGVFQPICLWSRFLVIFGQQNGIRSSPALSLFPGVRVEQVPSLDMCRASILETPRANCLIEQRERRQSDGARSDRLLSTQGLKRWHLQGVSPVSP